MSIDRRGNNVKIKRVTMGENRKNKKEGTSMNSHILIVEDEELIREELKILLQNAGYDVTCITDFTDVAEQVRTGSYDLVLLDVNLPGQDGYSICSRIRTFSHTPILFLTGRSTPMDELQALTLGGDDYVAKPYNAPVLLARIRLLLRRADGPDTMEYKGIRLNPVAGTLAFQGKESELTKTELKILYCLFCHPGEIISRMDLVEYLWDQDVHIDDNTLSVNVMRIREKLRGLGIEDLIQTKRGMGYKI